MAASKIGPIGAILREDRSDRQREIRYGRP